MNKRICYYVSPGNGFTILASISLLCSLVFRFLCQYSMGRTGFWNWGLFILPLAATVIFIIDIIFYGREHLYRTAIPIWMFALYYVFKYAVSGYAFYYMFLKWVACFAIAYIYTRTVSGKEGKWLISVLFLVFSAATVYSHRTDLFFSEGSLRIRVLPDVLLMLSGLFLTCAMRIYLDEAYHPYWGDRSDGRRVRSLTPYTIVIPFIMPVRSCSSNFIADSVEVSAIDRYIAGKRKEGYIGFGITHIFLAAYVRCIAKYPGLNRFLAGQRIYSRGDDIQFCMVVKSEMDINARDSAIKLHLTPYDTMDIIYRKLTDAIAQVKNNKGGDSDFDKTAKYLSYIPGILFRIVIGLIKFLDYFGLLPKFLLEVSPFHGTIFFTSMASLGIPPIVHHLYDLGNLPVFCAFGVKRSVDEVDGSGNPVRRKYVDYTFNTDERTVDGFYYASVMKYFKKLLAHPEKLELPPEEVNKDVE